MKEVLIPSEAGLWLNEITPANNQYLYVLIPSEAGLWLNKFRSK